MDPLKLLTEFRDKQIEIRRYSTEIATQQEQMELRIMGAIRIDAEYLNAVAGIEAMEKALMGDKGNIEYIKMLFENYRKAFAAMLKIIKSEDKQGVAFEPEIINQLKLHLFLALLNLALLELFELLRDSDPTKVVAWISPRFCEKLVVPFFESKEPQESKVSEFLTPYHKLTFILRHIQTDLEQYTTVRKQQDADTQKKLPLSPTGLFQIAYLVENGIKELLPKLCDPYNVFGKHNFCYANPNNIHKYTHQRLQLHQVQLGLKKTGVTQEQADAIVTLIHYLFFFDLRKELGDEAEPENDKICAHDALTEILDDLDSTPTEILAQPTPKKPTPPGCQPFCCTWFCAKPKPNVVYHIFEEIKLAGNKSLAAQHAEGKQASDYGLKAPLLTTPTLEEAKAEKRDKGQKRDAVIQLLDEFQIKITGINATDAKAVPGTATARTQQPAP